MDRRKQKTREALRQALSELIDHKSYDQITVRDLAERADVSRSSFYLHFRDKDDLLISGFEEIGVRSSDDVFQTDAANADYPNFAIVLFRGAEQWQTMSRACLCEETHNVAAYHMRNLLVIRTREWLRGMDPSLPGPDLECTVHYLASALQGLLVWWVRHDFPYPADVMSDRFNRLAVSGLQDLLHLPPRRHSATAPVS